MFQQHQCYLNDLNSLRPVLQVQNLKAGCKTAVNTSYSQKDTTLRKKNKQPVAQNHRTGECLKISHPCGLWAHQLHCVGGPVPQQHPKKPCIYLPS